MSWVTSAKCFNGLVCIGDIQATVTYRGKTEYINCIKKVHHIYENLVVGFAGDVKTGLLMIEELKIQLNKVLEKDTFFDLDGQTDNMINYLKSLYDEIVNGKTPYVELLFCWYAQDEDENNWNMYNWKFISPTFKRSSNGVIQSPTQIGSGRTHTNYQDSLSFLTGDPEKRTQKFDKVFENNREMIFLTIKKYRNFLINQAKKENYKGVSKSFYSLEATVNYNKLYSDEDHEQIKDIYRSLQIELDPIDVDGDTIFGVELNMEKIFKALKKNPSKTIATYKTIFEIIKHTNKEAIFEPPKFEERFHPSNEEDIMPKICSTWEEFKSYMSSEHKLPFAATEIVATA